MRRPILNPNEYKRPQRQEALIKQMQREDDERKQAVV